MNQSDMTTYFERKAEVVRLYSILYIKYIVHDNVITINQTTEPKLYRGVTEI